MYVLPPVLLKASTGNRLTVDTYDKISVLICIKLYDIKLRLTVCVLNT